MLMVAFVLGFVFLGVCLICFTSNVSIQIILMCLKRTNIMEKHDDIGLLNLPITFPKHQLVQMRPMCVQGTCVFVETELEVSLTLPHQTCSVSSVAV